MPARRALWAALLLTCALGGAGPAPGQEVAPAAVAPTGEADPLEPLNRGIFWFNDRLDVFLLEPLGQGWEFVTPFAVRQALDRFFTNLRFPVRFVGSLLQGELGGATHEVGRFVVNSTVGLAGFFDPATGWGLELHREDFGQALGRWGLGEGFYLELPLFGPSNPRDALGRIVDSALSSGPALASSAAATAIFSLELVNTRALLLDDVREAKEASLDYYAFRRNAYRQRRAAQIRNEQVLAEEPEDDLYELDDEE